MPRGPSSRPIPIPKCTLAELRGGITRLPPRRLTRRPAIEQIWMIRPAPLGSHSGQEGVDEVEGAGQVGGLSSSPSRPDREAYQDFRSRTLVPALQTRTSTECRRSRLDPGGHLELTASRSATSSGSIRVSSRPTRSRVAPSLAGSRPTRATRRPIRASSMAVARPIPLPAPVMTAVDVGFARQGNLPGSTGGPPASISSVHRGIARWGPKDRT